ncbi:diacylglycerol kinase family protein [Siphonobacter aquaeclarae]|jgi:diacylglycerol kinase|uniref:Diacylglycerol kinase (ATP) n=1 Tax=Siphonobacter aquaeclarae TaxID=563176 RepID=A0A1G9SKH6_9BACT|nr:diacylglycerol kinase family protein [Siphonobacter aquaeclarae]MBO9638416.1 diacylglycerol kinase family protein [Siphonobacter aquaeclarae]SDM35929.1 diacylglycerol kinase (ATP) [Siphonobacter aquaeclarae]
MPINVPKFFRSVRYALHGLKVMVYSENNARIHLVSTVLVILLGIFLQIDFRDWFNLLLAITLVWVTEAINTAIEKMVDMVSPEYRKIAGEIKDLAAGAVLVAAIFALVIGIMVFQAYLPWEEWLEEGFKL